MIHIYTFIIYNRAYDIFDLYFPSFTVRTISLQPTRVYLFSVMVKHYCVRLFISAIRIIWLVYIQHGNTHTLYPSFEMFFGFSEYTILPLLTEEMGQTIFLSEYPYTGVIREAQETSINK